MLYDIFLEKWILVGNTKCNIRGDCIQGGPNTFGPRVPQF